MKHGVMGHRARAYFRRGGAIVAVIVVLAGGAGLRPARGEPASALPVLTEDASLETYLKYAALNNAGLEAAFNRWKAEVEKIPQARALPDPRFNYVYFVEEVETRVGPQEQKFGIAQMFPWFGKLRLRGDAAAESAAAAQQDYEKTKLALFYRVTSAFHDYWYLAQAIEVSKQHLNLVTHLEGVARTRFKAGVVPNSAVVQAQVELGKLDDRLRSMQALRAPVMAQLNATLNRPVHETLPWPAALPVDELSLSDEQIMNLMTTHNPDLLRLDHLAAKEEAGIRLAKRNYFPDVTLGVDYIQTGSARMAGTPDSGQDPIMAMVSINLPIWRDAIKAAEREARLRKTVAEESRIDAGRRLESELALALYHFRDAERKIDLYGNTLVPKAEQSLKVAQQDFETGGTTFIALIDAERLLLEFELAQQQARAERGKRLAEIETLVGGELGNTKQHNNTEQQTEKGQ